MQYRARKAKIEDKTPIFELYQEVAKHSGGLARRFEEIDLSFVERILTDSMNTGLILVLESEKNRTIVCAIHATGNSIQDLRHVMSQLTFLVRPDLQGKGLGKYLFKCFLEIVQKEFPHIYRVEFRARASNLAALGLYESLGFKREGLFRGRIRSRDGELEDGIPMVWFSSACDESAFGLEVGM